MVRYYIVYNGRNPNLKYVCTSEDRIDAEINYINTNCLGRYNIYVATKTIDEAKCALDRLICRASVCI